MEFLRFLASARVTTPRDSTASAAGHLHYLTTRFYYIVLATPRKSTFGILLLNIRDMYGPLINRLYMTISARSESIRNGHCMCGQYAVGALAYIPSRWGDGVVIAAAWYVLRFLSMAAQCAGCFSSALFASSGRS